VGLKYIGDSTLENKSSGPESVTGYVPSDYDLTFTSDPAIGEGRWTNKTALRFNGGGGTGASRAKGQIGSALIDFGMPMTVVAWINPEDLDAEYSIFNMSTDNFADSWDWYLIATGHRIFRSDGTEGEGWQKVPQLLHLEYGHVWP
jgi:hypothetical protein